MVTRGEHQDDHPKTASPLCGGRTTGQQRAGNVPGDVRDDGRLGESGIRRERKDDPKVFRATERSTEITPRVGVETALWPTAAKKEC